MMDEANEGRVSRAWIVPASAILFALTFLIGMMLAGMVADTADKPDAEVLKNFDDNKVAGILAGYLLVVAGLAFLPVAWTMARRVGTGMSALARNVARSCALLFVAMLLAGGIVFASMSAAVDLGGEDAPPAEWLRFIPQIGFGLVLLAGALSLAVFFLVTARAGQLSGAIAKWFWIVTYVAAVAMVFGVLFVPMILLPIWAIASAFQLQDKPA